MKIICSFTAPLFCAAILLGGPSLHAAEPPVRLEQGHTDIGLAIEDDAWNLHIHDEVHDIEYAPDEAVLVVRPGAYATVPNDPRYAFLGLPCSGLWILPQTQNTNLLFLGFGAEEIEEGVLQGNQFRVELKSVAGPGDFIVYDLDPFGTPIVIMNSRDGVDTNDSRVFPSGAHSDLNWAFTAPGTYAVSFEASATLSNGTFLTSGPVEYTFVVEATNTPPAVLYNKHTDIGLALEDGAWDLHVHNHTDDIEYAPDEAVLLVRSKAFTRVPDDARYSFLGAACTPMWILPQTQNTNLLFLGFAAEEIEDGVFQGDQFRMELTAFDGPGNIFVYDIDSFGTPVVYMNTADGVNTNDFKMLVAGAHNDLNWAFTQPGVYHLSFEASGTLSNGTFIASGPVEYTFCVEAGPIPLTSPQLTIARTLTNQVTLAWPGETGATYQLQSTAGFPPAWTNVGAAIPGVCGPQQVTLPASNAATFYRLAMWAE